MNVGDTAEYLKHPAKLTGGLACVHSWNTISSKRVYCRSALNTIGVANIISVQQPSKFKVAKEMIQTAEAHTVLIAIGVEHGIDRTQSYTLCTVEWMNEA